MSKDSKKYLQGFKTVNIANCSAKPLGQSNLVVCQSDAASCYWRQTIGGNTLCAHTLNFMIARPDGPLMRPMEEAGSSA